MGTGIGQESGQLKVMLIGSGHCSSSLSIFIQFVIRCSVQHVYIRISAACPAEQLFTALETVGTELRVRCGHLEFGIWPKCIGITLKSGVRVGVRCQLIQRRSFGEALRTGR
jgi:hypothetical protein